MKFSHIIAHYAVVGVLVLLSCSCVGAQLHSLNDDHSPNDHSRHRHIIDDNGRLHSNIGSTHGNGIGRSHSNRGGWNGRGLDNGFPHHPGHQMHLHWIDYVRNHIRHTLPAVEVNLPSLLGPPPNLTPRRVPTVAEWRRVWQKEVENCGYPGTPPFLKDLRIATLPEEQHSTAQLGNYPWMVSLKWKQASHWCGGALISEQWVVTAVHCLFSIPPFVWGEQSWVARLGVMNISADHEATEQVFNVTKILVHPLFDKNMILSIVSPVGIPSDHDIALVKLSERVQVNPWVRPVCLPQPNEVPPAGTLCVVTGWGWTAESHNLSDILKQGKVPVVDYVDCQNMDGYDELLTPNVLCAGYREGGVDACKFDSGGPLQCRNGDQWVIVGVVSWGDKNEGLCAKPQRPGVYSRVDAHMSWIQDSLYRDYAGLPHISWDQILPNPMLHPYT